MNTLYIGDNVKVLKEHIADGVIDLTVTSPPYDDLRTYNGFEWDIDGVIEQLWRVTKQGGVVVWVVGDKTHKGSETGTSFRTALKFMEYGWRLYDTMIYLKDNPMPINDKRYQQAFEYMFVFSKGVPKTTNIKRVPKSSKTLERQRHSRKFTQRDSSGEFIEPTSYVGGVKDPTTKKVNVWNYLIGFGSADELAFKHPAIFPEKLAEDHILSWSNEGDVVLDLFGGSGTTAKMAALNNRKFVHIDISEEYVREVASARLEQHGIEHEIKEVEK